MIKQRSSPYLPGGRSGGWHKFKWLSTADGFITSYKPGENSLSGMVGSVTLSILSPDIKGTLPMRDAEGNLLMAKAVEVATVGVFTNEFRRQLTAEDGSLKPEYMLQVMEFACQGIGTQGMARHPRFIQLRPDKKPKDCTVDQLDAIPKV